MRRLFSLVLLLLCAIPFGVSISGCSKNVAPTYCNGGDSGFVLGQLYTIDFGPRLTGISLNAGQIGFSGAVTSKDCRNSTVSPNAYVYGTSDNTLLDIQPSNGRLCAGTWNRNTGGGIADYTVCTPNGRQGVAYITASADGATSNAVPVFVHPVVTSVEIGTASTNCATDPATNCIDLTLPAACSNGVPAAVPSYTGTRCLSQGDFGQLAARTFAGVGTSRTNISCIVGPLTFTALDPSVVSIDQNGLATARQPGSTTINANVSNSSSSAGFFSTCPPKSIVLTPQGTTAPSLTPVNVNQNTAQTLVAVVTDTNDKPINNLALEYVSTNPNTVPAGASVVVPAYAGGASITANCAPPTCNNAPFAQIGLFGNGLPVSSNPVIINSIGNNNSTVLFAASTQSQYIQPYDFTTPTHGSALKLPYVPNSLAITQDRSTIYLGSSTELMVFSTFSNQLTREDRAVSGTVLAVSPDGAEVVITDPIRKLVYLYASAGNITTEYGGVGTRAVWNADSRTVYITTADNRLLVYSTQIGWTSVNLPNLATDVTVTVPNAGVYLANGPAATETGRTDCPVTTVIAPGPSPLTSNVFYPQADVTGATADRNAATSDGLHILGASATRGFSDVKVAPKNGACPVSFASTTIALKPFSGAAPASIVSVLPTSDSAFAFVTYNGAGSVVPQYAVASSTLTSIPLQTTPAGTPLAPVSGVLSTDDQTLFVGTSGDNLIHLLTRGASGFTDTVPPIAPNLPGINGGIATPDLLAQRPRKTNS